MSKFVRKQRSFKRKSAQKSGDIILIVCEGAKTERYYFNDLKSRLRLPSAQIHILDTKNKSAPINVVKSAIKERGKENRVTPDHTWCVIDCDKHSSLDEALKLAKDNEIHIAFSSPCFEFWYLLHYDDSTRDYSSSNHLIRELKKHIKKL